MALFFLSLAGCNSCNGDEDRKYDVMQRYGGWQARMDETKSTVKHIESHYQEYDVYALDSLQRYDLSTEYPYWDEVLLHAEGGDIKRAILTSSPDREPRWEKFYFENGMLIYASRYQGKKENTKDPDEEYFFEQNTLVFALDEDGEKRDIEDQLVLLNGVDLINEAKQILGIFASNNKGN